MEGSKAQLEKYIECESVQPAPLHLCPKWLQEKDIVFFLKTNEMKHRFTR